MLAGDASLESFDSESVEQQNINFRCLRAAGDYRAAELTPGFPASPCPGGIRMEVMFPSCSNGEADSQDHVRSPP